MRTVFATTAETSARAAVERLAAAAIVAALHRVETGEHPFVVTVRDEDVAMAEQILASPATPGSNPAVTAPLTATPTVPTQVRDSSQRELWLEVGVVLLVVWLPILVSGFASYAARLAVSPTAARNYTAMALGQEALHRIAQIALLLYLVHRSRQGWSSLRMRSVQWGRDLLASILIAFIGQVLVGIALFAGHSVGLLDLLHSIAPPPLVPPEKPEGMECLWFAPVLFLSVLMEELLYRGYLSTRLSPLLRSRPAAILVSALLFALPHIYQGGSAVLFVFVRGCFLAFVLTLGRWFWPLVFAHYLYDLWVLGYFKLPWQ